MRIKDLYAISSFKEVVPYLMECKNTTRRTIEESEINKYPLSIQNGLQFMIDTSKKHKIVYNFKDDETRLLYIEGENKPFVLICAGGGYQSVCTFLEAFPICKQLHNQGYPIFILSYTVRKDGCFEKANQDVKDAIVYIQNHISVSKEYFLIGFSAGGHLVGEMGTTNFGYKRHGLNKPLGIILCYGVVDIESLPESDMTIKMLQAFDRNNLSKYCIHRNMDNEYPDTYIWQCEDDDTIGSDQIYKMINALNKYNIPYKSKIYPKGGHGLMKEHEEEADRWIDMVLDFMNEKNA